jgi:tRNA threonylcarbamoyladenosine biosynthesis protein TsaB
MLLALDTATAVGSAALLEMDRVVAACYFDIGLMHSRRIFVAIDQMIQDTSCGMDQIDVVGVSIGPGSYTGLRIGLGAAKGFCLTGKRSLIAVSTLETLAARLPYARHPVCALLDARNERVYTALYDTTAGYPTELSPPRAGNLAEVLEERAGQATIFTGDGAWVYRGIALCQTSTFHSCSARCGRLGWTSLAEIGSWRTGGYSGLRAGILAAT